MDGLRKAGVCGFKYPFLEPAYFLLVKEPQLPIGISQGGNMADLLLGRTSHGGMKNLFFIGLFCSAALGLSEIVLAQDDEAVKVTLKDGDLGFKELTVKGGEARFDIENAGKHEHAFEIEGDIGGKKFAVASRVLKPGQRSVFIVELPAGTYEA
jgi:cupredoxin-like protein